MDNAEKFVTFTRRTVGRDRLYRLIQYTARFVIVRLGAPSTDRKKELLRKLVKLESGMGTGRKMMRLAKTLDYVLAVQKALGDPDPVNRGLMVVDSSNLGLRMVFDNLQWLAKVGVYDGDEKWLGRMANTFWFLGLIVSVVGGWYRLMQCNVEIVEARRSNDASRKSQAKAKKQKIILDLARDMCDLLVPAQAIELLPPRTAPLSAFTGVCASVIGLYQAWRESFPASKK